MDGKTSSTTQPFLSRYIIFNLSHLMIALECVSSADAIVLLGYVWMKTSSVTQPAKKPLTQTHGQAALRAGTARGFPTKSLGKSASPLTLNSDGLFFVSISDSAATHVLRSRHCRSEVNQPNKFEIYRTAQECCDEQFTGSATCLQASNDSHAPFPWPIHFPWTPGHRPFAPPEAKNIWGTEPSHTAQYFPDLINKQNCVRGNNYENWMQTDGFQGLYLFGNNATRCCQKW